MSRSNILSFQSHVVYGYVGNAVSVFPLQRLGHTVWPLNTVTFSNHPKHGRFRGHITNDEHIRELAAGLIDLGVTSQCDAIVTGYLGDTDVGFSVLDTIQTVRAQNPDLIYCCDPVMGHEQDGFFVPEDLQRFFRDVLVPMADIIVPNQFELEFLEDQKLIRLSDVISACRDLRERGPDLVIVTSLQVDEISDGQIGTLAVAQDSAWLVITPHLPGNLFGAGDLFAALFVGNYMKNTSIPVALSNAVSSTYGILAVTARAKSNELELIQAQQEIISPSQNFEFTRVN